MPMNSTELAVDFAQAVEDRTVTPKAVDNAIMRGLSSIKFPESW